MEGSDIQWTNDTFNAVEGCEKVSAGCKNCYAEARNDRFHGGENWGPGSPRLMRSPAYWNGPKKWNREAEKAGVRRRVFAGSLCDVCEDHPDWIEPRKRLAGIILSTPWLDWQMVTKRPENYRRLWDPFFGDAWPANVWALTSVENQEEADRRIPHLLRVPAKVRGLSMEPLLGPVDLSRIPWGGIATDVLRGWENPAHGLHWLIIGGESGSKARPFDLAWAREIIRQAEGSGVAVFMKQLGSSPRQDSLSARAQGSIVGIRDSHGGDESEWPLDLRNRRAFPVAS